MEPIEARNPFSDAKVVSVNTDPTQYHKSDKERGDPGFVMSFSESWEFAFCPLKWRLGGEQEEETKSMKWGSLVDCLLLTPDQFSSRYILQPEKYTNSKGDSVDWTRKSTSCQKWEAEQNSAGKTVIDQDEHDDAMKAISRIESDEDVRLLLDNSDKQVWITAKYRDDATGLVIPVKCMIDLAPFGEIYSDCIADLKTIRNAAHGSWIRDVWNRGYYVQSAFYLWMFNAAKGQNRNTFLHIVSENVPPYITAQRCLANEFIVEGQHFILGALWFYCQCLSSGVWPDYDHGKPGYQGWTFCNPEPWMISKQPYFAPIKPEVQAPEFSSFCAT